METKKLNSKANVSNITPGQITLIATGPAPEINGQMKIDNINYDEIVNCGFNAIMAGTNLKNGQDICKTINENNHNLKFILSSTSLLGGTTSQNKKIYYYGYDYSGKGYDECVNIVNGLKNQKALGAWRCMDEPAYSNFQAERKYNDGLIDPSEVSLPFYYKSIRTLDPSHPVYFNLDVSTPNEFSSHYAYLEYIQSRVSPDLWSYDYYPFFENTDGIITFKHDEFYNNLDDFHRISQKTGKPFWAHVLCVGFQSGSVQRPTPTIGQMRLEAFSALAYGAQGLVYWFYAYRKDSDTTEFSDYPIKESGGKSNTWYMVQTVNKEIKKYNNVFAGCTVESVIQGFSGSLLYGPIKSLNPKGQGILVSHISNNGYDYLIIVSSDGVRKQDVDFEYVDDFNSKYIIFEVTENFISNSFLPTVTPKHVIRLDIGGYAILRWKKI